MEGVTMGKPKFVIVDDKGMFFDNSMGVWRNEYADATVYTKRDQVRRKLLNDPRVAKRWTRVVVNYGMADEANEFERVTLTEAQRIAACPCAQAMGCLCAGHARGNAPTMPCDTSEG